MNGIDSVLDYAEQQRILLSKEAERLASLKRELAALLQFESEQVFEEEQSDQQQRPQLEPDQHVRDTTVSKQLFPSIIDDANQQSSTNRQVQLANHANHDPSQFAGRLVPVRVNDLNAIENNLTLDEPPFAKLGRYEEKRRELARQRKREYNEYLQEKARLESEKQKRRHLDANANLRRTYLQNYTCNANYSNLLERKRQEEKAYREVNGLSVIHELEDNPVPKSQPQTLPPVIRQQHQAPPKNDNDFDYRYMHEFSSLEHRPHAVHEDKQIQTVTTNADTNQTSLNNPVGHTVTFAEPTSRLLSNAPFGTESSVRVSPAEKRRQEAFKYREELRKQIEEKRRRAEEQRRRDEIENRRVEARIEEQRRRMLEEYYDEEERQRRKTDELIKKQELAKQNSRPDSPIRTRTQLPSNFKFSQTISAGLGPNTSTGLGHVSPRSPSYVHVKLSSSTKVPPLHRHTSSVRTLEDRLRRTSISVAGGELEAERKRASPEPGRVAKQLVMMPDGTVRPNNPTPPRSQEGATEITHQIQRSDEMLGKLTEFRKKLQEDHLRMLNDLKPGIAE